MPKLVMDKMNKRLLLFLPIAVVFLAFSKPACDDLWGFYGHRLINRMAVFTMPPELIGFFKKNIDYMAEHAVDPDKRRYATKHEGVRHYIDIDIWDKIPFPNVPRDFEEAIIKHCKVMFQHILTKKSLKTVFISAQHILVVPYLK